MVVDGAAVEELNLIKAGTVDYFSNAFDEMECARREDGAAAWSCNFQWQKCCWLLETTVAPRLQPLLVLTSIL